MNAWNVTVGEQTVVVGGTAEQAKSAVVDYLAGNREVLARIISVTETSMVNAEGATVQTIGSLPADMPRYDEDQEEIVDEPDCDEPEYNCSGCDRDWNDGENFCPECGTERN